MRTQVTGPTWVQRNISPVATRVCARNWMDRRKVASMIRSLATHFKETGKIQAYHELDLALKATGYLYMPGAWIRSKLRPPVILEEAMKVKLEDIQDYDVRKTIRLNDLLGVIERVFEETGLISEQEGSGLYDRIVLGVVKGRMDEVGFMVPTQVNYRQQALRPEVLRDVQIVDEPMDEEWQLEIIGQAFDFAREICGVEEEEALNVIQKMAGIGGDVYSVIAALVRHVPVLELKNKFDQISSMVEYERLYELWDAINPIVGVFQFMRDNFVFDVTQLAVNEEYLFEKMSELARVSQTPQALLVFFLHELGEAREAKTSQAGIFERIRILYSSLAERLGLIFLADDFRDQYLRLAFPEEYREMVAAILERIGMSSYETAKIFLRMYRRELFNFLKRNGVDTEGLTIKFRVKSPFSVWNKLRKRKKYGIERLHDILGIKIICSTEEDHHKLLSIVKLLEGKNNLFIPVPGRKKTVLQSSELKFVKKEAFAEVFDVEKAEQIWQLLIEQGHINDRGELLMELEDDPSTFKLQADCLALEDRAVIFDILKKAQEIVWRGVKLEGHDPFGKPIEIQIVDEKMNQENARGKAATWLYNLSKELGAIVQRFPKQEIREVFKASFFSNFQSFKDFWSKRF